MILQANKEKASDFKRRRTQIILREKERDTFQSKQNEKSSRESKKNTRFKRKAKQICKKMKKQRLAASFPRKKNATKNSAETSFVF